MTSAAAPPRTDLKDTLEELRASVAARGARKGLRGAIQEAILGFLECLLALLADLRAGRLAAVAQERVDCGGNHAPTPTLPRLAGEGANGADAAVACPSPSRIGPHFRRQKRKPVPRRGRRSLPQGYGMHTSRSLVPFPSALKGGGVRGGRSTTEAEKSSPGLRPDCPRPRYSRNESRDSRVAPVRPPSSSASVHSPPTSPDPSALKGGGEILSAKMCECRSPQGERGQDGARAPWSSALRGGRFDADSKSGFWAPRGSANSSFRYRNYLQTAAR